MKCALSEQTEGIQIGWKMCLWFVCINFPCHFFVSSLHKALVKNKKSFQWRRYSHLFLSFSFVLRNLNFFPAAPSFKPMINGNETKKSTQSRQTTKNDVLLSDLHQNYSQITKKLKLSHVSLVSFWVQHDHYKIQTVRDVMKINFGHLHSAIHRSLNIHHS